MNFILFYSILLQERKNDKSIYFALKSVITRWTDGGMAGWRYESMDGGMDGRIEVWMGGGMDGLSRY